MKTTLLFLLISLIGFSQTTLIKWGSPWKYLSQTTAAPSAWNTLGYSDSGWPSGNTQLGYGDGDEATITPALVSGLNVLTTYFRKTINISTLKTLEARMMVDDGAVVYVNGVEVYRYNLPTSTILYSTLTPTFTENQMVKFDIPATNFVLGTNVIALEVHQNRATSSDMSFNFDLSSSLLVDYDYPFYIDVTNPTDVNTINWGSEFSLPSRFMNSWQYIRSWAALDAPIKHGFTHTITWIDMPSRVTFPIANRDIQWGGPGCPTYSFFETYRSNATYYNQVIDRYKNHFKTHANISWTESPPGSGSYICPTVTGVGTFTNNAGSFWAAAYDNSGTIVKNSFIHSMDYEIQYGIDRYWGPYGLDNWLQCLKSNSTTGSCLSYSSTTGTGVSDHLPTPAALSSLSFFDFKKVYFRARIKDLNSTLIAYKSLLSSPGLYNNYGTDIEDVNVFNTFPTVTWSQLTTDPTKLSYVYRDTTNFTSYGNYYVNNLDIHTNVNYFGPGRLGEYGNTSGYWLQTTLYQNELTKAWNPTKPCMSYVWLKADGALNYHTRMDTLVAEALPIFSMMVSDGVFVWDGEQLSANNRIYEYYIKGMRRLSHFNGILTPTTVTRYSNFDPVQIRNMQIASFGSGTYTFGIARGIIKGDSILIAAMNPNAKINQVTKIPINFSNASYTFNDTVTVVGRKCFLGSAKMTPLGVTTVINSIFEKSNNALIYPNPSKTTISIMGLDNTENIKSIVIRDILGREMFTTNKISDISIESLTTGNYFVSIFSNENVLLKTLRFIKE